ncbi:hypothetical protein VTP01DRAFT_5189 [Rhizomucor pusillus]|uniref:uncharacterized protein n=1 Tax=Rhizomucor pusillus TaxID=4840 RepID=UPI0037437078
MEFGELLETLHLHPNGEVERRTKWKGTSMPIGGLVHDNIGRHNNEQHDPAQVLWKRDRFPPRQHRCGVFINCRDHYCLNVTNRQETQDILCWSCVAAKVEAGSTTKSLLRSRTTDVDRTSASSQARSFSSSDSSSASSLASSSKSRTSWLRGLTEPLVMSPCKVLRWCAARTFVLQRASAKDKRAIRQHVERDLVLFCGSIHDFGLNGAEETRTWRARVNEAFQCLKGTTATKKECIHRRHDSAEGDKGPSMTERLWKACYILSGAKSVSLEAILSLDKSLAYDISDLTRDLDYDGCIDIDVQGGYRVSLNDYIGCHYRFRGYETIPGREPTIGGVSLVQE